MINLTDAEYSLLTFANSDEWGSFKRLHIDFMLRRTKPSSSKVEKVEYLRHLATCRSSKPGPSKVRKFI